MLQQLRTSTYHTAMQQALKQPRAGAPLETQQQGLFAGRLVR